MQCLFKFGLNLYHWKIADRKSSYIQAMTFQLFCMLSFLLRTSNASTNEDEILPESRTSLRSVYRMHVVQGQVTDVERLVAGDRPQSDKTAAGTQEHAIWETRVLRSSQRRAR